MLEEENSFLINEFKFDNISYSAVNNKNERKRKRQIKKTVF